MQKHLATVGPTSLLTRDKESVWHPFTQLVNGFAHIAVKEARGVYLYTEDGQKIIDAVSSWWVNLHGHSHPEIARAIAEQAQRLEHVIFAGFTHEPAVELAENLLNILPHNQSKVFYSDNGSTAVEVALKMAFQFWYNRGTHKRKVIAIEGAYHGDTFGSMAVGDRGPFSAPFEPFLFEVEFIDFPEREKEDEVLSRLTAVAEQGEVAAFIYEPLVLGAAGMKMYSADWLEKALHIAHTHEVICIADEVFTGFGRTGKYFASQYLKAQPDIVCMSKGLTGGAMALGATSCTERIIEAFRSSDIMKTFFHGHSFTANPIACAAANASYRLLVEDLCQNQIQRVAEQHTTFQRQIADHPGVKAIRSLGVILALEIDTPGETSYVNEVRHKLYPYFIDQGILLRPLGNVIYVVPPYCIEQEELQQIYRAIKELLDTL